MSGAFVVPFCKSKNLEKRISKHEVLASLERMIEQLSYSGTGQTNYTVSDMSKYQVPAGKTVYITPKDADFSGGTVLCAIPELVAASAGWDNTIISVGTSDDGKNIRLYSSVSQNLYVRVIFLYT